MPSPLDNNSCAFLAFENSMVHIEFQGRRLHRRATRLIPDEHECIHFAQLRVSWNAAMAFCNVAVHLHDNNFLQYYHHVLLWCDNAYLWRFNCTWATLLLNVRLGQGRTQGGWGGWGYNPPFSLIFYEKFITCAKEIHCFRILFAC